MNTPWGESQSMEKIIDGMYFVTTAGHGGIYLSLSLNRKVVEMFPTIVNNEFYHRRFWEEDCMWCFPYIALETQLKHLKNYPEIKNNALQTLESLYPEEHQMYLEIQQIRYTHASQPL